MCCCGNALFERIPFWKEFVRKIEKDFFKIIFINKTVLLWSVKRFHNKSRQKLSITSIDRNFLFWIISLINVSKLVQRRRDVYMRKRSREFRDAIWKRYFWRDSFP